MPCACDSHGNEKKTSNKGKKYALKYVKMNFESTVWNEKREKINYAAE